jgi:hypothetical protein
LISHNKYGVARQTQAIAEKVQTRKLLGLKAVTRTDRITQGLAIFFLIKPTLDLTWFLKVNLAGISVSPLHLSAFAFILLGGWCTLRGRRPSLIVHTLFLCFFLEHFLSIGNLLLFSDMTPKFKPGDGPRWIADLLLRIFASLIALRLGCLTGMRRNVEDGVLLIKSMFLGNLIALSLNAFAMLLGYGPNTAVTTEGVVRTAGLYYDPGILGFIAAMCFSFAIHLLHAAGKQRLFRAATLIAIPLTALLIIQSGSKSATILIAITVCFYALVYRRGTGKISAVLILGVIVAIMAAVRPDSSGIEQRLSRDVKILTTGLGTDIGADRQQGRFSFGQYEGLGNNRGRITARAIDKILKRPLGILFFGYCDGRSAHCDYVDVLGRNGFVGLALYLTLLATVVVSLYVLMTKMLDGNLRTITSITLALVLMYVAYSVPFRPLYYTTYSWYMWCLVGYVLTYCQTDGRRRRRIHVKSRPFTERSGIGDVDREHPTS